MYRLLMAVALMFALMAMGCGQVHIVHDDDVGERGSTLETQSCEDRCMEQFHQCRKSGGGGGPGASGCAHEKNACKDRC